MGQTDSIESRVFAARIVFFECDLSNSVYELGRGECYCALGYQLN